MKKEILIGIAENHGKVVLEVELEKMQKYEGRHNWDDLGKVNPEDAIELSICGHYTGSWGQIYDSIPQMKWKQLLIPQETLNQLLDVWKNYHLNGMKSGTRIQSEFLQFAKSCPHIKWNAMNHYDMSCHLLRQHSLLIDRDYQYGTAWLYAPLPPGVIQFIQSYTPQSSSASTRSDLLDWIISNEYKFKIISVDSNPNMIGKSIAMDHWLCTFWNPSKPADMLRVHYSTGLGHRIGLDNKMYMTWNEANRELIKWKKKVKQVFEITDAIPRSSDNKWLKELGFILPPMQAFPGNDITPFPMPPMPDDVLNCIAREVRDIFNHNDWMDWAENLGFDLNSKSERRKLQKAFITLQDQADAFNSVFPGFPFELVE